MKKILLLFFLLCQSANSQEFAKEFAPEITQNFEKPIILGQDRLRIWGFHIYDIQLISESGLDNKNYREKFAIQIKYARNFSKEELIDASITEIKRIDKIDESTVKIYEKYFDKIFTNVKKGDEKIAIIDEKGLQLYYNRNLQGVVENRNFALSFGDIWLSKNAKYQDLRNKLLGL